MSAMALESKRFRLSDLPSGMNWREVSGIGLLAGIGFTVSLLVTSLALPDEALGAEARLGILSASAVAGIAGYLFLLLASRTKAPEQLPQTVDLRP